MKKLIFPILALSAILFSCQKKESTLSGEIKNASDQALIIRDYRISYEGDTIPVVNGKFQYTVATENPGFKYISYGSRNFKPIFLVPGYDLKISFDAKNFDSSYQVQGKGATENIILDSITIKMHQLNYQLVYTSAPEQSKKYLDSIFLSIQNYFEKQIKEKHLDPLFISYQKASLAYENAGFKTSLGVQKDIKDTTFYSFINTLTIENEDYLTIPSYQNFLRSNLQRTINSGTKILKVDSIGIEGYLNCELRFIEEFKSAKIRDYLLYSSLSGYLSYNGVKNFNKYYDYFKKHNTDSTYSKEIQKMYAKKSLLAPGQIAPEFACMDKDNNPHSLKEHRGKYVYIDFWATWCGPCRMELPNYLKLQQDYKGKNIVFISISLDEDKNSWLQMVNQNKSEGMSLLADGGWNAMVARDYQIAGIPTFVLIDKEGKIIDSQAPRPSSNEIRKTLDELLSK